jgi:hypothetical protein
MKLQAIKSHFICLWLIFAATSVSIGQSKGEYPVITNFDQASFSQLHESQIAFSSKEKPFGSPYHSWCEAWIKHVYSIPCDRNPLVSPEAAYDESIQEGDVFFLAGTLGGTVERNITIPAGKGIFFPILNYMATYPCPYTGFKPAPGQSLKDFLMQNAAMLVEQGTYMSVTIDGIRINDLLPYRIRTELFYFRGLPELTCMDPCVTGELQPGLADGYWIMLKPLSPGLHKLQYKGSYPKLGWNMDVTYHITIE